LTFAVFSTRPVNIGKNLSIVELKAGIITAR
jgi:hypothetical protein